MFKVTPYREEHTFAGPESDLRTDKRAEHFRRGRLVQQRAGNESHRARREVEYGQGRMMVEYRSHVAPDAWKSHPQLHTI